MPGILKFFGSEMFRLLLLALLVEAAMNMAPEVARQLGGVSSAPSLGGYSKDSAQYNIEITGANALDSGRQGMLSGFMGGNGIIGRAGAGLSGGYSGLMRGGNGTASEGLFTDVARDLVGLRRGPPD